MLDRRCQEVNEESMKKVLTIFLSLLVMQSSQLSAQPPEQCVVLLHGLARTSSSMVEMEQKLQAAGYQVVNIGYPSRAHPVEYLAEQAVDDGLQQCGDLQATRIHFVTHSLGSILVRYYFRDRNDPRLGRVVMLGPPNQGAAIARRLAPTGLYGIVTGKGGMELGPEWEEFVQHLSTPPFPFAIIAGDLSENTIQNPLLEGSSDFVVGVDEAQLDGAESFTTVPVLHSFLMNNQTAKETTIEFIKSH